jgi:hypothetical protein
MAHEHHIPFGKPEFSSKRASVSEAEWTKMQAGKSVWDQVGYTMPNTVPSMMTRPGVMDSKPTQQQQSGKATPHVVAVLTRTCPHCQKAVQEHNGSPFVQEVYADTDRTHPAVAKAKGVPSYFVKSGNDYKLVKQGFSPGSLPEILKKAQEIM